LGDDGIDFEKRGCHLYTWRFFVLLIHCCRCSPELLPSCNGNLASKRARNSLRHLVLRTTTDGFRT
jgi:hypothetical protein